MFTGVAISKLGRGMVVHFIGDVVGYGLHGIGLVPFVDRVVEAYKIDRKEDKK